MLPKLSLVATSMLAVGIIMAVSAAATVVPPTQPQNNALCCNALLPTSATAVTGMAGLLGLNVSGLPGLVGLVCTPFSDHWALTVALSAPVCCAHPKTANGIVMFKFLPIECMNKKALQKPVLSQTSKSAPLRSLRPNSVYFDCGAVGDLSDTAHTLSEKSRRFLPSRSYEVHKTAVVEFFI
ncbi:hypothetical protein C8J57DRAFT_1240233 [Mycena rebaudengoi]|nr:hypothetical protein C8J57DRAFT_1240233 [Mycena rebaudengoi]